MDITKVIRTILSAHERKWQEQREEMIQYKNAYETKFFKGFKLGFQEWDYMSHVETADGYAYIEGFIASLFSKAPAIEINPDSQGSGDHELVKAVANNFLFDTAEKIQAACRMALVYPAGFMKLAPRESNNLLEQVSLRALKPWEVIVDEDASSWDEQRYLGHVYYITVTEAKERFGNKQYRPVTKENYFDSGTRNTYVKPELPDEFLYIKVVEFYDLLSDTLYWWSPNYGNGEKLLEKESPIPLRTYDDRPLPCIVPLYFSKEVDAPLNGISTMSRIYGQIKEKNILRTWWANAVRRDSRQYIYKRDAFDEEDLAKITAGIDGAMVGTDQDSLSGLISEIPVSPISSNHDRYLQAIENDLARGSILAPFARGVATNSSATEVSVLDSYTASEIGRLAKERDSLIEKIALIYVRMIALLSDETTEKEVLMVGNRPRVVSAKDLDGKYKIVAADQSSSPISKAIKQQQLVQLTPTLVQLGVSPEKIRDEIIRSFDFPESFKEAPPEPQMPPEASMPASLDELPIEDEVPSEMPMRPQDAIGLITEQ